MKKRDPVKLRVHRELAIHYLTTCEENLISAVEHAKEVFKLWDLRDRKSLARAFDGDIDRLLRRTKSVRSVFEHYQP